MDQELLQAIDLLAQMAKQLQAQGDLHEKRIVAMQKIQQWVKSEQEKTQPKAN